MWLKLTQNYVSEALSSLNTPRLYEVIIGVTQEPLWEFEGIVWEKEKLKKKV